MNKHLEIINHYGVVNQQRKLNEEMFELQEAITTYEISKDDLLHIAEEIADCEVLLEQLKAYYNIPNCTISRIKRFKIDRQIKRIGENK